MIGLKTAKPSKADETDAYEVVTLRDMGVCVRCRRIHPLFGVNRDHRKGRGVGGLTTPANLQLLCGSGTTGCHGWKGDRPKDALEEGYAVPGWAEPTRWPGRRWFPTELGTVRLGWALYDNFGNATEIPEADAFERMKGAGW